MNLFLCNILKSFKNWKILNSSKNQKPKSFLEFYFEEVYWAEQ